MDQAAFEAQLRQDGFEVEVKQVPGGIRNDPHTHDFEVRALVLDGEITLTCGGTRTTYRTGEVFTMAAGMPHSEEIPAPYRFVVGRRHPAGA